MSCHQDAEGCKGRAAWRVVHYRCNHSAFNGYHWTPSDYSLVTCDLSEGGCGVYWRTKAKYVEELPHLHLQHEGQRY